MLIGIGMGGEADITPYLLSRYFGLRSLSTLYGLTWSAYAVAGALGPVLMGRAFDLTGSLRLGFAPSPVDWNVRGRKPHALPPSLPRDPFSFDAHIGPARGDVLELLRASVRPHDGDAAPRDCAIPRRR